MTPCDIPIPIPISIIPPIRPIPVIRPIPTTTNLERTYVCVLDLFRHLLTLSLSRSQSVITQIFESNNIVDVKHIVDVIVKI